MPRAQLSGWRITSKRTPSGREYRVYYGPLGEHVRSRSVALQLASLYDLPPNLPRIPSPPPITGAPTANGHANALAALANIDPAGAAASAAAIAQSTAAVRAHMMLGGSPGSQPIAPANMIHHLQPNTIPMAMPLQANAAGMAPSPRALSPKSASPTPTPSPRPQPQQPPLPNEAAALADMLFEGGGR